MKKLFQLTALLAVLALMSSPAWSLDYEDHVSVAPNGQGDVLIFPVYFAFDGGFQTKLQVVNTKMDASAVAKVVIRSMGYSEEVRDFFIFLSPTDVWEGYLVYDPTVGKPVIYSDDDSTLTSFEPTFATPADPFVFDLETPTCPGDTNLWGYAEVFLAWVFPDPETTKDRPGTTKESIFNRYIGDGSLIEPQPEEGDHPLGVRDDWGPDYTNILAGNMQIQNPLLGWTSALNAVTLKDYLVDIRTTLGDETFFSKTGIGANNTVTEVEAALSKQYIGLPYINNAEGNTLHFVTFPTKLMQDDCATPRGTYYGFQEGSPQDDHVVYSMRAMDMMERTPGRDDPIVSPIPVDEVSNFPWEVNFLMPIAFDKGWYRYTFTEGVGDTTRTDGLNKFRQPLSYTGAPAIPLAMNFGAGGFSTMYGFWSDGNVTGEEDGVVKALPGFQYVNSFAFTR